MSKMPASAVPIPHYYNRKSFPLHEFIFVGCWNRVGPYRDAVAKEITKTTVKTVILGGDNVYQLPEDKEHPMKPHRAKVFYEGIQLYMNKGKDIIGTLGNHNIAFALDEANDEINMKDRQMKVLDMPNSYYFTEYDDECCIVVLDTNLEGAHLEAMCMWLDTVVKFMALRRLTYYIVQHEPFFSVKGKKKKEVITEKYQLWDNRNPVLEILFNYLPICVLCADTHLYQQVEIHSKKSAQSLLQIVVGTGGAEHDLYTLKGHQEDDSYTYNVTYPSSDREFISAYGYLHVFNKEHRRFVPVKAWEGGKRSRRQKRKTRKSRKNRVI